MKLKDTVKLEIPQESVKYILDILVDHQKGYSVDFASERIQKIREVIDILQKNLYK